MAQERLQPGQAGGPDEYELAAALAAVQVFADEVEAQADGCQATAAGSWAAAAVLEGVAGGALRLCRPLPAGARRHPWLAPALAFLPSWLIIAALLFSAGMPVLAQGQAAAERERAGTLAVRVCLTTTPKGITVDLPQGADLKDALSGRLLKHLPAASKIILPGQERRSLLLEPAYPAGLFELNGKLYRGRLLVRRSQASPSAVNAINIVDLEEYLLSVVPSEMPSGWPLEALKAQAIAARSYAVSRLGTYEAEGFDLKATTEDQVYAGVQAESPATSQAVAETAGIVLKHEGKVVPAFFHSTSGGYTRAPEPLSGRYYPFLKAVPDYDDRSPYFTWSQNLAVPVIEEALRGCGRGVGSLLGVYVIARAQGFRAGHVLVVGSEGIRLLTGEEMRRILKLPSTNFNVGCAEEAYVIAGRGFGHGMGLSQWGARALAENGYNAAQILAYYYKDVSLDYLEDKASQIGQDSRAQAPLTGAEPGPAKPI